MISKMQDAYGREIYDYLHKGHSVEIVERDDGWVDISAGAAHYFAPYEAWLPFEKKGIKYVRGRVLDIGCGAGRVMNHLESKGHEVTGIDNSPLAIKVCQELGLQDVHVLSITQASRARLGLFDSIVMYGNNFGLMGSFKRARWLLKRFHSMTTDRGRIIAASTDPHETDIPEHLWYHKYNRRRGRMPGQLRIRIRYRKYMSPYFDYLLVSKKEMMAIVKNTGWQISRFVDSNSAWYVAVLDRV